jgi:hypothetical protein
MAYLVDAEAEAGYCIEQIRARNPFGPVRRHGGVAVYPRPVLMRDAGAAHQIVLIREAAGIAVSCNCLRRRRGKTTYYEPLEVRTRWEPGEPAKVHREHLKAAGISQREVKRTYHPRNREG